MLTEKVREKHVLEVEHKHIEKTIPNSAHFFLRNQFNFYFGGTLASTVYDRRALDLKLQQNP